MKNSFLYKFRSTIYLKVKGKNIERFIKRLNSLNIEIYDIKYLRYDEIIINIDKYNYKTVDEIKTIYEITIMDTTGYDKFKLLLKRNRYIIISLIICSLLLFYLSNTIFEVEIVHNDSTIRNLLKNELEENDMKIFSFRKNYNDIQKIKKLILEKYKDKIEWLEIERVGTKYIVRVEERIINKDNKSYILQDIVAKKDATILKIEANNGEIVKNKNDYVRAGDTIITGSIKLNDEVKDKIMAKGKVYGEVWYKVTIEYPLKYSENILTGKVKNIYAFNILNKSFEIFNLKKVKTKKVEDNIILKHNILPISFVKQKQYEIKKVSQNLSINQAIDKAEKVGKDKIISKLSDNEYIIDTKKLKVEENDSKIVLELFVSVYEDITDYKEIIADDIEIGD